jgi:hypothetical protein
MLPFEIASEYQVSISHASLSTMISTKDFILKMWFCYSSKVGQLLHVGDAMSTQQAMMIQALQQNVATIIQIQNIDTLTIHFVICNGTVISLLLYNRRRLRSSGIHNIF